MARQVYSEIYLHVVWHTKEDEPVLRDLIESRTHAFIKHKGCKTPGVFIHEVGGIEDHVHIVMSVPATLTPSVWIGETKGASSYHINQEVAMRKILEWQNGYGIVSFGKRDLPWVVDYVRNQKTHHQRGTVHDRLERIEAEASEEQEGAKAP